MNAESPISLDDIRFSIARVKERLAYGLEDPKEPIPETTELHHAEITSTTQTAGRYPGTLYEYDADADSYTSLETIWVDTIYSGQILQTSVKYDVRLVGLRSADGIAIYRAMNPPSWLWGKLDSALSSEGSPVDMSIWSGTGAGTDTTQNVQVYGALPGSTIASGTRVGASFDQKSNLWQVSAQRC